MWSRESWGKQTIVGLRPDNSSIKEEIHLKIGKVYSEFIDIVILINNSATSYILQGLKDNNFNSDNIYTFKMKEDAYKALGQIINKNDVVIFQNDWTDNYF